MSKAIVVFSGGQDSTTCLYYAIQKHGADNVIALTIDYGQRHSIELESANKIATLAGVQLIELVLPHILCSHSPLVNKNTALHKYESFEQMEQVVGNKVESTFVPMRNMFFLTIAANYAVHHECDFIYTGVCQQDNANYPDCTRKFIDFMQLTINESLGLECNQLQIITPLMDMSKAETVILALDLPGCMEALAYSHTSYDGKYPPTDNNHSNLLRAKGFEEAGIPDPLVVRAVKEGLMELPNTANYDILRGDK